MTQQSAREKLENTFSAARRRMLLQTLLDAFVRLALIVAPVTGALVAADRYWNGGRWTFAICALALTLMLAIPLLVAQRRRLSMLHVAVEVDEQADLKGRLSSAWEFLLERRLDAPRLAQIRDAVQHGSRIDAAALFPARRPRYALFLPLFLAMLGLSFLVPPRPDGSPVEAAVDVVRVRQVQELRSLREDLNRDLAKHEELREVIKKLEEVEKRFDRGELNERDVMIQLARLDEDLRQKMTLLGIRNLEAEVDQLTPHLMAGTASRATGSALKSGEMDKAATEMDKLAERGSQDELSEKEKEELCRNMGVASSKLGTKGGNSFGGDLAEASEALKSGDGKGFGDAARKMAGKFTNLAKHRQMEQMRQRMSMCKTGLGQKECSACNGQGCSRCQGQGQRQGDKKGESRGPGEGGGKGGLEAGTQTAGDPQGDANRLQDSYRELLQVSGMAGNGPVESEVETVEGQVSPSQLEAKDLYEEYAAVAEQAIEREEIPLSHRFHVKRYFQSIRPAE